MGSDKGKCGFSGQKGVDLVTCRLAGAGHPNEQGAQKYFTSIKTQLDPILDQAGWKLTAPVV